MQPEASNPLTVAPSYNMVSGNSDSLSTNTTPRFIISTQESAIVTTNRPHPQPRRGRRFRFLTPNRSGSYRPESDSAAPP